MKVHSSEASKSNPNVESLPRAKGEKNVDWMKRAQEKLGNNVAEDLIGSVVLIGGASLNHFRMRVAQSHARHDLTPSYWSHAAILTDGQQLSLCEVSLEPAGGFKAVPQSQGIQSGQFSTYDNPNLFPNVALLRFTLSKDTFPDSFDKTLNNLIQRLHKDRGTIDILSPLWTWLGYVWGVQDRPNPLLQGVGLPSAIVVETVFSMMGVEVTPGLASQSSCPEAIWQAVKWWGDYYDSEATLTTRPPSGCYCLDQPAAAVTS